MIDDRFKKLAEMNISRKYGEITIIHKQMQTERFTRRIINITDSIFRDKIRKLIKEIESVEVENAKG